MLGTSAFIGPVILAAALAALLLGLGWRGRRIDRHPLCRKCGFDLVGRPTESVVCPECGADLRRRRSIRIGHRQKRRWLVGESVPVLIVCVGWLGLVTWSTAAGVDWNRHKPAWILMREADSADAPTRDAAIGELERRLTAGQLPAPQAAAVVEKALAHQANADLPWVAAWGQLLESGRVMGRLTDEQWDRYMAHALTLVLEVRPSVRRGDPLPFRIRQGPNRAAAGNFRLLVRPDASTLSVAGAALETESADEAWHRGRQVFFPAIAGGPDLVIGGRCRLDEDVLEKLTDGRQALRTRVNLHVWRHTGPTSEDGTFARASRSVQLAARWTLLPADQPSCAIVTDPSLRPAVERSLAGTRGASSSGPGYPGRPTAILRGSDPPVGLSYDAPYGQGMLRSGSVVARPKDQSYSDVGHPILGWLFPRPQTVDIVLRPNPEHAARTVDVTEIWGHEVIIQNVPVP
jgi:predicted RNA-binding Zn-ribbon protein involved in translation (DUF1610 family)